MIDIGIPAGAPGDADAGLITPAVLRDVPRRGPDSTKFSSGNVVIIGGSRGLTGAPTMAALAAARAGAGYVTVAAAASAELSFTTRLLEVMFKGLPDADGALTPEAIDAAVAAVARADAVVLGPGLGRSPGAQALARELVQRIDVPLVIDADGLNAIAGRVEELRRRRWPTILTPHAGELGAAAGGRRGGDRARPPAPCPRGGRAGEGADRAQGRRHAGRRPVRARGDLAGRRAGAGHRGHGRRPLRA